MATFENSFIIENGLIFCDGKLSRLNLHVENGLIKYIGPEMPADTSSEIINGEDLLLIPGLTDMHVHFRQPGYEYKETIKTGSESAAAGGFTTVCTMPNLNPAPDSLENLQQQLDVIKEDACINVIPFATITRKRMGNELVDYEALAPYVAGFSDDGSGVQQESVMREAMEGIKKTGKILSAHCEVDSLLKGGYIHDGEYARKNGHPGICSESEWKEVERDIKLCEETGCRLHICHISTKESVELVRNAKKRGLPVTCETAPHYLVFTDDDLCDNGIFKMNPPIRGVEDREALREGLADGTIDAIATDHAPHSLQEKSKGLKGSAMGIVGLETAFSVIYTYMVKTGLITFERMMEAMAETPRKILGLPPVRIAEGEKLNMAVVDINKEYIVDPESFLTKGRATPFTGLPLFGKILATFYEGKKVY